MVLVKEEGASRRRFGKIEAEIERVITIKTLGGKVRNYEDVIKKMEGHAEV